MPFGHREREARPGLTASPARKLKSRCRPMPSVSDARQDRTLFSFQRSPEAVSGLFRAVISVLAMMFLCLDPLEYAASSLSGRRNLRDAC